MYAQLQKIGDYVINSIILQISLHKNFQIFCLLHKDLPSDLLLASFYAPCIETCDWFHTFPHECAYWDEAQAHS